MDIEDLKTWRVLIVDNESDSLIIVQHILGFYKADCLIVASGQECLDNIDEYDPTLIFLDIQMPIMSGWQVITTIRDNPRHQNLPVIALTAHAMNGDRERILKAGFNGYFPKPINLKAFISDTQAILTAAQVAKEPSPKN